MQFASEEHNLECESYSEKDPPSKWALKSHAYRSYVAHTSIDVHLLFSSRFTFLNSSSRTPNSFFGLSHQLGEMSSLSTPLDYSDGRLGIMISLCILATLATAAVVLRFWARKLRRLPLGLEDYFTLAALVMHHGLLISSGFLVVQGGLGRDIRLVETENPYAIVILFKVRPFATPEPTPRLTKTRGSRFLPPKCAMDAAHVW
jgi:hypothetical protein